MFDQRPRRYRIKTGLDALYPTLVCKQATDGCSRKGHLRLRQEQGLELQRTLLSEPCMIH